MKDEGGCNEDNLQKMMSIEAEACSAAQVLSGHSRPVSYVRFMGRSRVATASTDSSLALWDLGTRTDPGGARVFRRYEGHANAKNFVGLSVREDDELMATGSEMGQAVAYHRAWSAPVATHAFSSRLPDAPQQQQAGAHALGAVEAYAVGAGVSGAALEGQREQSRVQEVMSAVCWWPGELGAFGGSCRGPVLAAAQSDGDLRLLTLVNA